MSDGLHFLDQMNREVQLRQFPCRIVSLVPSQTELLFSLGLADSIVGITKFCIHPEQECAGKTRVGGTKNVDLQKIRTLKPDLIIANKEENEALQLKELMLEFPIWISNIQSLNDAYVMMEAIGKLTARTTESMLLISTIKEAFKKLDFPFPKKRAAYLIWNDPLMAAANDTFINAMLEVAGFSNVLNDLTRYPKIDLAILKKSKPDYVMLSTEPFPFKERQVYEMQKELPESKVILVDGEMFSWYGPRLLKSASYFQQLKNLLLTY